MSLHNATPTVIAFARYFARPRCPQCGVEQFVPERSEFAGEGRIRHAWLCEDCGHEFATDIEIGLADAEAG
jgi:transposase-like protein